MLSLNMHTSIHYVTRIRINILGIRSYDNIKKKKKKAHAKTSLSSGGASVSPHIF